MKKKGTRRCLHQDTKSLITPSLHLCFFQDYNVHFHAGNWMSRCCAVYFAYITNNVKIPNDECVGVIADSCKMYINL